MINCGIVEDIQDPEELGRVRVRVFGLHSHNTTDIPTEDLPWASVMQPSSSAANSGIGITPRLLQGSMVMLVFLDDAKQYPVVLGSVAAELTDILANIEGTDVKRFSEGYGFQDPTNVYPQASMIGENDISRLAKNSTFKEHKSFKQRLKDRNRFGTKATSSAPKLESIVESHAKFEKYTAETTFVEPPIMGDDSELAIQYPQNQVHETESGMIEEFDDSNTRRHSYHPSGTYQEIVADGSKTIKIIGLGTDIYMSGRNLYIEGDWNVTVVGNKRELITGSYVLEVGGDMSVETQGNKQEKVAFDSFQEIGGNQIEKIAGNRTTAIDQNETLNVGKDRATSIGEDEIRSVKVTEDVTIGDNATHRYSKNLKEMITEKSTRLTVNDSSYITGGTAYYSQTNTIFRTKEEESWTVNNGSRATTIGTDDTLTVSGAQSYTITGEQNITASVTNIANDTNITGTMTASTDALGGGKSLKTHIHSGVTPGGGTTGTPV